MPGLGVLATGVICPCHALVGLVGVLTGGAVLSPAAQDGIHAVYVPASTTQLATAPTRAWHGQTTPVASTPMLANRSLTKRTLIYASPREPAPRSRPVSP